MRDAIVSLRMNLFFVCLTGVIFPLVIFGLAQLLFPHQANGSLKRDDKGKVIGSEIIGQQFAALKYFHPRPSAAGSGYDGANSSGTNLGPTSAKLFEGVKDDPATTQADESYTGVNDLAAAYRTENELPADALIPVDAVTRSASGLDPDISPANAILQAQRVAKARGISVAKVKKLVNDSIEPRFLGIFGDPRVNVFKLNLALDATRP